MRWFRNAASSSNRRRKHACSVSRAYVRGNCGCLRVRVPALGSRQPIRRMNLCGDDSLPWPCCSDIAPQVLTCSNFGRFSSFDPVSGSPSGEFPLIGRSRPRIGSFLPASKLPLPTIRPPAEIERRRASKTLRAIKGVGEGGIWFIFRPARDGAASSQWTPELAPMNDKHS